MTQSCPDQRVRGAQVGGVQLHGVVCPGVCQGAGLSLQWVCVWQVSFQGWRGERGSLGKKPHLFPWACLDRYVQGFHR